MQNDLVNFVDPSGLDMLPVDGPAPEPTVDGGFVSPGIHTTSFFGWYDGRERSIYGLITSIFIVGGISGGARGGIPESGGDPQYSQRGKDFAM